jgi:2-dehydro-3-deoxyphosphooctonate aldolase (KDO 8-P synthase)
MDSTAARTVRVGDIDIANDRPFVLIAGPCQIDVRSNHL